MVKRVKVRIELETLVVVGLIVSVLYQVCEAKARELAREGEG